jgi:hypothetical protein
MDNFPYVQSNIPNGQRDFPLGMDNLPQGIKDFPYVQSNIPKGIEDFPYGKTVNPSAGQGWEVVEMYISTQNYTAGQEDL